jgi:penicillin-binding protein 1B
LGAYEITPLEAVGAYTMFANQGAYVKPGFLTLVRDHDGKALFKNQVERKNVLDPRVAYLMTNLMEEVLRSGTGAGVRPQFGFYVPAAGKTGTSSGERDGWFAGYTTELLCVVWVGFDDNRDLDLEGAKSAAPIWGDFMKRALAFREYRDTKEFPVPAGIVSIEVDSQTGMPATSGCPKTHQEVFIVGTEPMGTCPLHGGHGGATNVAGWDTSPPAGKDKSDAAGRDGTSTVPGDASSAAAGTGATPASVTRRAARQAPPVVPPAAAAPPAKKDDKTEEKKGLLQRILGVFK